MVAGVLVVVFSFVGEGGWGPLDGVDLGLEWIWRCSRRVVGGRCENLGDGNGGLKVWLLMRRDVEY